MKAFESPLYRGECCNLDEIGGIPLVHTPIDLNPRPASR